MKGQRDQCAVTCGPVTFNVEVAVEVAVTAPLQQEQVDVINQVIQALFAGETLWIVDDAVALRDGNSGDNAFAEEPRPARQPPCDAESEPPRQGRDQRRNQPAFHQHPQLATQAVFA